MLVIFAEKVPLQIFDSVESRLLAKGLKYWAHSSPGTQNVNWAYIRCSEDVLDVFWMFYVRSIYVLYPRGCSQSAGYSDGKYMFHICFEKAKGRGGTVNWASKCLCRSSRRKSSLKNVLKILQNSQENICAGIFFSAGLQLY